MEHLPEWLKIALGISGGVAAWGLTAFFFHGWVDAKVVEPISELKEDQKHMKHGFISFTERVTGFVFDLNKGHRELSEKISQETVKMSNMFAGAMQQVAQAKIDSTTALEKANALVKTAEEQNATTKKLFDIVTAVHKKNQKLETEVKVLGENLILVRDKVDTKHGTKS